MSAGRLQVFPGYWLDTSDPWHVGLFTGQLPMCQLASYTASGQKMSWKLKGEETPIISVTY